MKLYNAMLAVGGGRDHTFPLSNPVTAAEIVVLRALHGDDAVFDIEPAKNVATGEDGRPTTVRALRADLRLRYQSAHDRDGNVVFDQLFPGANAPIPLTIDELGLPDDLFKALGRAVPVIEEEADEADIEDEPDTATAPPAPPKRAAKAAQPVFE